VTTTTVIIARRIFAAPSVHAFIYYWFYNNNTKSVAMTDSSPAGRSDIMLSHLIFTLSRADESLGEENDSTSRGTTTV